MIYMYLHPPEGDKNEGGSRLRWFAPGGSPGMGRPGWVARGGSPRWVAQGGSLRAGRQGGSLATHPRTDKQQTNNRQTETSKTGTPPSPTCPGVKYSTRHPFVLIRTRNLSIRREWFRENTRNTQDGLQTDVPRDAKRLF